MRHISSCLTKELQTIYQRTLQLTEFQQKINSYLPEILPEQYSVSSFVRGCLIITTNTPTVEAQFRYIIPWLRNKLRNEAGMYQLVSIKLTVINPKSNAKLTVQQTTRLSKTTQAIIITASETCQYEPLKAALQKLAGR